MDYVPIEILNSIISTDPVKPMDDATVYVELTIV